MAKIKTAARQADYRQAPEYRKSVEHIKSAVERDGPYSHNIVGLALSEVARRFGVRAANALIEEFMLDDLYGFAKQKAVPRG